MGLVVELIHNCSIEGWGLDEADSTRPLRVVIEFRGQRVAETRSDIYRVDLDQAGVGSGHHGFRAPLSGSDWVSIICEPEGLSVYGLTAQDDRIDAYFYHTANPDGLKLDIALGNGTLRLIGDSYLKDNIVQFHGGRPPLPSSSAATVLALSIKMQIFGDAWWWEDGPEGRTSSTEPRFGFLDEGLSRRIADGEILLILDMSNEAPAADRDADWCSLVYQDLGRRGIPPERVVWISQNERFAEDLRAWSSEHAMRSIHGLNYGYYPRRFVALISDRIDDVEMSRKIERSRALASRPCEKAFVCLNFTPRPERVAFVAWLAGSGLLDRGFVSFEGFSNHKLDNAARLIPEWYPDRRIVQDGLPILADRAPMRIDLEDRPSSYTPEFDLPPQSIFDQSLFSIITESECSNGDVIRITEKTLKAIACFHPFVIVGNPRSLTILRAMGFKTFSPHIDETYDEHEDPRRRLRYVHEEIRRLTSMDDTKKAEFKISIQNIVTYNYIHLLCSMNGIFGNLIERDLIESIIDIASDAQKFGER